MLLNKSQFIAARDSMLALNNVNGLIEVSFDTMTVYENVDGGIHVLHDLRSEWYESQTKFFETYEKFFDIS